jgi:hypothetical protein
MVAVAPLTACQRKAIASTVSRIELDQSWLAPNLVARDQGRFLCSDGSSRTALVLHSASVTTLNSSRQHAPFLLSGLPDPLNHVAIHVDRGLNLLVAHG